MCKIVTPGDDEVCFQCWDAKIRTSPKRKVHFKVISGTEAENASVASRPVKREANKHKRKALDGDFAYTIHAASDHTMTSPDNKEFSICHGEDLDDTFVESKMEPPSNEEGVILDEENAVILLSTAFRTIPHIKDVINIKISSYSVSNMDETEVDDKSKKRGAYCCGKCGQLKKGHICDVPSPKLLEGIESSSPVSLPIQSISIQLSPSVPPQLSVHPSQISSVEIAFAQPVVS